LSPTIFMMDMRPRQSERRMEITPGNPLISSSEVLTNFPMNTAIVGDYLGYTFLDIYLGLTGPVRSSSMTPSRLSGQVAIGHNGTTATGTGTLFSTELSVGDVFHTTDENIILEDSSAAEEFLFEADERIQHEDLQIRNAMENTCEFMRNIRIADFRLFISTEEVGNDYSTVGGYQIGDYSNEFGTNGVPADWDASPPFSLARNIGTRGYDINTTDESYYTLGEASNAGLYVLLEDSSGQLVQETSDSYSEDLLLETDDKMLFTEPGEFKVASITNDTSLVVTRKHWGGTDVVPFWKRTTPIEVISIPANSLQSGGDQLTF